MLPRETTIWSQDPLAIVLFLLILLAALAGLWVIMLLRVWMLFLVFGLLFFVL